MDVYIQNKYCPCTRCRMNKMMLPIVLVTLGLMLLIDNLPGANMRGGTILAIMLITFGAVRLLQSSASVEGHRPPGELPAAAIPPVPPAQSTSASTSQEVQNG
jgi:hypothetical protein